jgi:transposase
MTFGTVIVDLERRQVVELLADRSASTAAEWFERHPEIEVVSRDRAGLYADAARQGAPQARQVADRFHLLKNFRDTPWSGSSVVSRRRSGNPLSKSKTIWTRGSNP